MTSSAEQSASGSETSRAVPPEGSAENPIRVPVAEFVQRAIRNHPEPGNLAYAQMVAERYGDLDDAAVEDGME